jgi:predicted TIM-barrel fold metal-dependent hydrolase
MKKIDFETHFATPGWVDAMTRNPGYPRFANDAATGKRRLYYSPGAAEPYPDSVLDKLLDIGEGRVRDMEAAGVDVMVLSLTAPGVEQLEPEVAVRLAREVNDAVAEAMARHPGRFVGYAALPVHQVDEAVGELRRCVRKLGFKGWKTHSNYGESFLDEERYRPLLAACAELGVPIYLHPTATRIKEYWDYGVALAGPPFGFGAEASLTMMRLVLCGAFDAFPGLKVVMGHYGEGLPFILDRIDAAANFDCLLEDPDAFVPLKKRPSAYLRENMWVSTSCNYLPGAFWCSWHDLGESRVLFGTD